MWEFAPQKKDLFGSKYWDPFLFHITCESGVKSLGFSQIQGLTVCPENDKSIPLPSGKLT